MFFLIELMVGECMGGNGISGRHDHVLTYAHLLLGSMWSNKGSYVSGSLYKSLDSDVG